MIGIIDRLPWAFSQILQNFTFSVAPAEHEIGIAKLLLLIAMFFGIGIDSQASEIRFNLLKIAKSKPAELLASLDSPEVTCRASIHQAKE